MLRTVLIGLSLLILAPQMTNTQAWGEGWDPRNKEERSAENTAKIERSEAMAAEFLARDPSLQPFFDEAYGYAVFPIVRKGGFVFGGARASGILFKGGEPEKIAVMTQYNTGLQFGMRSFSQIIFFKDRYAYDRFDYGEFTHTAGVTAILSGKGDEAIRDFSNDVAVFVNAREGAMIEASIGGQNFGTRDLN